MGVLAIVWLCHVGAHDVELEGHCGTAAVNADCKLDDSGSWPLNGKEASSWSAARAACVRYCHGCARCRYVSYSIERRDCSWFEQCDTERLPNFVRGFRTLAVAPASRRAGLDPTDLLQALPRAQNMVVTVVNNEMLSFAKNWLCSLSAHLSAVTGVLLISMAVDVCEQLRPWLQMLGAHCIEGQVGAVRTTDSEVLYRSGTYDMMMRRRLQIFANLSSRSDLYSRLLFIDVDVVLHADPFLAVRDRTEPLLYASDRCDSKRLNGGVVAVRPGAEALKLMQRGITQLAMGKTYDAPTRARWRACAIEAGTSDFSRASSLCPGRSCRGWRFATAEGSWATIRPQLWLSI